METEPILQKEIEGDKKSAEEIDNDFKRFENQLVEFIEKHSNSSVSGFFTEPSPQKTNVRITGTTVGNFIKIAKILEEDPFYSQRITIVSIEFKLLNVSWGEKPQMKEPMSLAKEFIQKMKNLLADQMISFEIETPMVFIASAKETIEVKVVSTQPRTINRIKTIIRDEWSPQIDEYNPLRLIITTKWEQIKRFILGEEKLFVDIITNEETPVENVTGVATFTPPEEKKARKVKVPVTKKPEVKSVTPDPKIDTSEVQVGQLSDFHIYESFEYDQFHFLPFNRETNTRHIRRIMNSIKMFGVLSFVIVVETDCIDGEMKKWIVDGQHRLKAFILLGKPVLYIKVKLHTKEEVVKLVAELNTTSHSWSLKDYLHVWSSLDIHQYLTIDKYLKETGLPITVILEIFSGLDRTQASKNFKDGDFIVKNEEKAIEKISWIMETKEWLPKSREILSALVVFINQTVHYNNNKMLTSLKQNKEDGLNFFVAGDTMDQILKKIKRIYDMRS